MAAQRPTMLEWDEDEVDQELEWVSYRHKADCLCRDGIEDRRRYFPNDICKYCSLFHDGPCKKQSMKYIRGRRAKGKNKAWRQE